MDITDARQLKIVVGDWGDNYYYDRADIVNPILIDTDGKKTYLTALTASSYTSDWSTLHINKNVEGGTLRVNGKSYSRGLGMNAKCTLIYDLPEGHKYTTFQGIAGYDSSCDTDNPNSTGTTMEFFIYVIKETPSFDVDLTLLGYGAEESVPVYDIWAKEDLEPVVGTLSAKVASHGTRLFRLGDKVATAIDQVNTDGTLPGDLQSSTSNLHSSKIYDLTGRQLSSPDAPSSSLQKGIYIIDGKKMKVK